MKRFVSYLSLLLAAALLFVGAVPAFAAAKVKTTSTATAPGFEETVTVTLTVADGVLTKVTATTSKKGETIGKPALEKMPLEMVKRNSVDVDTVSGATGTSKAILKAAKSAMAQIGGQGTDLSAWAETNGYVKAEDYHIVPDTDVVSGASYQTEVAAQKENNLLSQDQARELARDYLRGFVLYYELAAGSAVQADRIYVQSNVDLFEALNAAGGSYQYGDTFTGVNGRIYTYGLPSYPIDTADYRADIQLGKDTVVTDAQFVAAIGKPVYAYREMYAIGTAYNNMPGLAQSEAVLDPESMIIYMGSNPGSEKSKELAVNPNIKMYWYNAINEDNYVCGGKPTDNDYYHSYGVRIEGVAGAIDLSQVIDEKGNVLDASCIRGGIRYGLTVTGPKEWYAGKPDADLDATAAMLAETRYYTEEWAGMNSAGRKSAAAGVKSYLARAYLGSLKPQEFYAADIEALKQAGKEVNLTNLKSVVLGGFMNRSGEGYAIRLASTGALIKVVPDVFLTNTLWAISDVATADQVKLYEAGGNEIMGKWAAAFYELYQKLGEEQTATQIRRQAYYPDQDKTLDR